MLTEFDQRGDAMAYFARVISCYKGDASRRVYPKIRMAGA